MDIQAALTDKIARFNDVNKQLIELNKQIGSLQEQGRAVHQVGMQLQGAIQALQELKDKEAADLATSATAKLTLPEGVKPVIPEAPPAAETSTPAPAAEAVALEVK